MAASAPTPRTTQMPESASPISIEGTANDGAPGELDNVKTDVENVVGGDGNNTMLGGTPVNVLSGGPGRDSLDGEAANDTLDGGAGNDVLTGGAGTDLVTVRRALRSPSR